MQEQKYDSKEMKEWCEKYNKTPVQYYAARKEAWNYICRLGNRTIK